MEFEIFDRFIPVVSGISTPALLKPGNNSPPGWMVRLNQWIYRNILFISFWIPIMARSLREEDKQSTNQKHKFEEQGHEHFSAYNTGKAG
jgi:hypothetical protein